MIGADSVEPSAQLPQTGDDLGKFTEGWTDFALKGGNLH
jgi:hypothetical protein